MSKRVNELRASLAEDSIRYASQLAAAPGTPIISLHTNELDDRAFIDVACRLITAITIETKLRSIYAVHIDNWFGPRWLGFCGKLHGVAGVRSRSLKRCPGFPPFHPHRVLQARRHHLRDDGLYADAEELRSLHPHAPSQANIERTIRSNIIYAWYSGNSMATRKGVVMVYYRLAGESAAFYTMFNGDSGWKLDQHVGITCSQVAALFENLPTAVE